MEFNNKGKGIYSQDSMLDEKIIKIKIFNFFYTILRDKKGFNLIALCILIMFEMIQLISYAFDEPHLKLWKVEENNMNTISIIVGSLRISPLMKYVKFNVYLIIFFLLIVLIFFLCIFTTMQILFASSNSKLFTNSIAFTGMIINPLTIFLFTPIVELILLPLKCKDGKVDIVSDSENCWTGLYYLYVILGILACILLIIFVFFLLTFYFSPFQYGSSTIKLTFINDIILFVFKFIFTLRFLFISNEYISILILLILSLFLLVNEYSDMTYNSNILRLLINIRNIAIFWTYVILFVAKLCQNSDINGLIYLLLFGYPVIIYCYITYVKISDSEYNSSIDNINNINEFLNRTRTLIKLINSFIEGNKNINNNHEPDNQKNEILLKGTIKIHNETCINEECPLNKFVKSQGNYHVQKQCLLNYMNIYFEKGIKMFPQNSKLLIYFIQFNYSKRYNLNSARTNLLTLQKLQKNYHEEFIIYCIEQDVKKMKNNTSDNGNDNNELELENDLMEQKYQRLKFLIENSTKLYGEFWGIFATTVTNNLNTFKLYSLGEKLNKYISEINSLWDNDVKTKKIELSHMSIIQLYSRFLKEILWNKKKSDEISNKIKDEHQHHHEIKKVDEDNFHGNNMDTILENQDYIIFCSSNEKGKCSIIQMSNSAVHLFGYQKSELIGKPIEILMPGIFIDGHTKMLEEHIKKSNSGQNSQKDNFKGSDNKQILLFPKNKMGYIIPLNSKFIIYDDNDFSNTYIIKAKFEPKDSKSVYAFYILTKNDFTIESISSSALNLRLTMDLLKKYMIKMDILIRTEKNEKLNLVEKFSEFIEDSKKVTWVYPDYIYPKNDEKRKKDENLEELIEKSHKQKFNLQICEFKYNENEILGFGFKFNRLDKKSQKQEDFSQYIPIGKKEFMFDILTLNYIRTVLVDKKTGLRNLRDEEQLQDNEPTDKNLSARKTNSKNKKRKTGDNDIIQEDSEDDEEGNKEVNILTREKLMDLQTRDKDEIKDFIFKLQFFGRDISLEKHRPTKEKYPAAKSTEPLIKILLDHFIKRIESDPKFQKKNKNSSTRKSPDDDFYKNEAQNQNMNDYNHQINTNVSSNKTSEDVNREFSSDTSTSLSNIFNAKSIFYIKLLSLIIFLSVCLLISLEFAFTFIDLEDIRNRISYMESGYKLLDNIAYTKYFITEAVLANEVKDKLNKDYVILRNKTKNDYILQLKKELALYREEFTNTFNSFSSPSISFSKEYNNYVAHTNVTIYSFNDGLETEIFQTFSSAMNRIPTNVFYVSTITNLDLQLNMTDRNTYELMKNLLNSYYMTWRNVTILLVDDIKGHTKKSTLSIIILSGSFILTTIFLFIFWKLLINFSMDREKPINLFLTIKKNIFEELKSASESFSNNLLNKFFGNEENEEEAQQDSQYNIKANDINIVKFKASNENKISAIKDRTNILNYIKVIIFFIVCHAYMVFKFAYSLNNIKNMSKFTDVYDITHFAHTNIILSIDVIKSYFYDKNISIFYKENCETLEPFLQTFYNQTKTFESMLLAISKSDSFLDGSYQKKICNYLYNDFFELVKQDIDEETYKKNNLGLFRFKPLLNRLFEDCKYLSLQYLSFGYKEKREEEEKVSNYTLPSEIINDQRWIEVDTFSTIYVRYWFKNILLLMNDALNSYCNESKLIHVTVFIILFVFIALAYCIVWKTYEENLSNMLKRSFNLINLIPEEIKLKIVAKLNE